MSFGPLFGMRVPVPPLPVRGVGAPMKDYPVTLPFTVDGMLTDPLLAHTANPLATMTQGEAGDVVAGPPMYIEIKGTRYYASADAAIPDASPLGAAASAMQPASLAQEVDEPFVLEPIRCEKQDPNMQLALMSQHTEANIREFKQKYPHLFPSASTASEVIIDVRQPPAAAKTESRSKKNRESRHNSMAGHLYNIMHTAEPISAPSSVRPAPSAAGNGGPPSIWA